MKQQNSVPVGFILFVMCIGVWVAAEIWNPQTCTTRYTNTHEIEECRRPSQGNGSDITVRPLLAPLDSR